MPSRKAIRYAVRDGLLNQTTAGQAVFATRMIPVQPEQYPAIIAIYTFDDKIDPERGWQPEGVNRRLLTLAIEIVAAGKGADDRIDDVADEVEATLAADPQLAAASGQGEALVEWVGLKDLEIGRAEESDRLLIARQTWQVVYYTVPDEEEGVTPSDLFVNECPPFGADHEDDYNRIASE